MQNFSIGRRLVGMVAVSFLITVLGFAQSAPAAESLLVGADKTVSVYPECRRASSRNQHRLDSAWG